jgi:hypothetical protein
MKLIIAGGRDYKFSVDDFLRLEKIHGQHNVTEVVSGKAKGADWYGEYWAYEHQIPIKAFPADWRAHGKAAGPIRNREMAQYADAVALFPGGRGTQSMYDEAMKAGIWIYDFRAPAA